MKKLFFILILFCQASLVTAQTDVTNNGVEITIFGNTELLIHGSYVHNDTIALDAPIANNGTIELKGDLVNNTKTSLFTISNSNVVFSGDNNQRITGRSPVIFSELNAETKDSSIVLEVDIEVNDTLKLSHATKYGNVFLNNHLIDLGFFGHLVGELPTSRVFGDEGYIVGQRSVPGPDGYNENLAGIGIGFGTAANPLNASLGTVSFKRGHAPQAGATAKGSIGRFYILEPGISDQILSNLSINYLDTVERKGLDEAKFSIWTSTNNGAVWNRAVLSVPAPGGDKVIADSVNITGSNIVLTLAETDCPQVPVVDLGADTLFLCPSDTIVLDAENPGLFYTWSTGSFSRTITLPEVQLTSDSLFYVKVTDANGCVGTDTVYVMKKQTPEIVLRRTRLRESCLMDSSLFYIEDSIQTDNLVIHWDYGVSAILSDTSNLARTGYVYSEAGTYSVRLIATSPFGCAFDSSFLHVIHPKPFADFESSNICLGGTNEFLNKSILNPPPATSYALKSYRWDFGITGVESDTALYLESQGINPISFTYDTPGDYIVTLITETSSGCRDTISQNIEVFPLPDAEFVLTSEVCTEASILLQNNTNDPASLNAYSWTFGDGFISGLKAPEKSYELPGTYKVKLTVTTENLCVDSDSMDVVILEKPLVAFSVANTCLSDSIRPVNNSSTGTYAWDFGNGVSSDLRSPAAAYNADGVYTVKLMVEAGAGCKDSLQRNVTVYPMPVADFTTTGDLCKNGPLSFLNNSTGAQSYNWNLGDGNISNQSVPAHTYSTAGSKTVKLTVTSSNTCKDSLQQDIVINDLPQIAISNSITTCGNEYVLKLDDKTGLQEIKWQNSVVADSFVVNATGNYNVAVISNENCTSQKDIAVTLNSIFKPNLGNDTSVCDQHILRAEYPGSQKTWYSNNVSLGSSSQLLVSTSGTYVLEITDQNNCTGSDTINLVVNSSPVVDLGSDIAFCPGENATVTAGTDGNSYAWLPGGETTPSIVVTQSGSYSVIVTTPENCQASDNIQVTYHSEPVVDLGDDVLTCTSASLDAGNPDAQYVWSTSETSRIINVSLPGSYHVVVTNAFNCSSSDTIIVSTAPSPVVNLGPDQTLCNGQSATLDAENPGSTFLWNNGQTNSQLLVSSSGTYSVTVTNSDNCSTTDAVTITVMPRVQVELGADRVVCLGNLISLDAGYPGSTYNWGSNTGFTSNAQSASIADSGKYWVEVITPQNCRGSDTLQITVSRDTVSAEYLSVSLIDEGDTIQFINLSTQTGVDYRWDFGDGVSSTAEDPMHIFYAAGNYDVSLQVSNAHCSDQVVKTIIVNPLKDLPDSSGYTSLFNQIIGLKLYPNPTRTRTTLEVELSLEGQILVYLYDLNGRLLDQYSENTLLMKREFDITSLPAGIYLMKVTIGSEEKVLRLVKL